MIRIFIILVFVLKASIAGAGEPVLLPDVSPNTTAEFGWATILGKQLNEGLTEKGYIVLNSAAVRPVVGSQIDACFEERTCPYGSLQHLPARVAVVVRVLRDVERMLVQVAVYDKSAMQPVDLHELVVSGTDDPVVLETVLQMVGDLIQEMEAPPDNLATDAQAILDRKVLLSEPAKSAPEEGPPETAVSEVESAAQQAPAGNTEAATSAQSGPAPDKTLRGGYKPRHLAGVKKRFEASELDSMIWMRRRSPHGGRLLIEIRGGLGIGDVDRHADVHVTFGNEEIVNWYQEGPSRSERVRGALYIGYAPTAAFDVGVLVGLQYGFKTLVSGWTDASTGEDRFGQDVAQAVQVYIQPRVRFYLIWAGMVKPYVGAGFETRMFDALKIADSDIVDYPDPTGGVFFGPMGTVGVMIDPGPVVGFFIEGAYTHHIGIRASFAETDRNSRPDIPLETPRYDGFTVGVMAGAQFRL